MRIDEKSILRRWLPSLTKLSLEEEAGIWPPDVDPEANERQMNPSMGTGRCEPCMKQKARLVHLEDKGPVKKSLHSDAILCLKVSRPFGGGSRRLRQLNEDIWKL